MEQGNEQNISSLGKNTQKRLYDILQTDDTIENTELKISSKIVDAYCGRNYATIDVDDAAYIAVNGVVLKNEVQGDGDYVTIEANDGGVFSPEWEHSDIKLLFVLKESYILKDSFYKEGHRGGFHMNELYDSNDDLWQNASYRNMAKITYFAYLNKQGLAIEGIDFTSPSVKEEACEVFRKHAAVISANPFPGLAFHKTYTNTMLLNKWLALPQVIALLQAKVQKLAPKRVYGAFDLGRISSYGDLFGWLKGRQLDELVASEGEQAILGRRICAGGVFEQNAFVVDENHVRWIQGIHPSSRLSHEKMTQIAQAITSADE